MKKISKILRAIFLTCMMSFVGSTLYAQGPGGVPDDPSVEGTNGAVGHPVGGGAPIGTGACLLLGLSVAYGTLLFFQLKRKKAEDLPDQSSD
jgi:hypothetical protein